MTTTDALDDGRIRILHVEDDEEFAAVTAQFLEREDDRFDVTSVHDGAAGLEYVRDNRAELDCIVSDYQMPGMDGLEFLETLRRQFPDDPLPFVLFTGKGNEAVAAEALNAGASSYVQKSGSETYEYLAHRIRHDIQAVEAKQAQARFDTLVRALDDPVYVLDEHGRFTYVNDALVDLVGYEREEILGSEPSLIKDADAVATGEEYLGRLLSAGPPESVTFEVEIQPATGEPIPCEDHMGVLPYEGEKFRGSLGVLRDISDRLERERALKEAKEHYQLLVEQNLVGLYIARDGDLVYHNEPFAELFAAEEEANVLAESSFTSLVEPADQDRLHEALTGLEAGDIDASREPYVGVTVDGERVNIEILGRGIELDGERAVLGTVVDVGKDEEQYWELRRERDRLEEFTSVISHDLRNPLNVATSRLALACEEVDSTHLDDIETALDRMEELLDDLLALARQGKTVDEREAVGLYDVATSTWANVQTGEADLTIDATGTITADPTRIKGLFENLYRNAVEHGGDSVGVEVGDLEDGFYVADDGAGIPQADREKVFESGYTTAAEGTGFGLAIVKEIVEAHGWDIQVTESEDEGARFEIRADERSVRDIPQANS